MADNQKTVFTDGEVDSQVVGIVREAKEYVTLISPYLELWGHARTALGLAANRGVKVAVVIRAEDRNTKWKPGTWNDIAWLTNNGIEVLAAEWLHAKIYLNEHAVFISSMNLTEVSATNSLEIGLVVREREAQKRVRDYVNNIVIPQAKQVSEPQTEAQPVQLPVNRRAQPQSKTVTGHCIRCGRPVFPDPSKPLCDDCYDVWAEYENEDYPEQYCFACGKEAEVSYDKPLCGACFRQLR